MTTPEVGDSAESRLLPNPSSVLQDSVEAWRQHGATGDPPAVRAGLVGGTIPDACRSAIPSGPGWPALQIGGIEATHDELDGRAARAAAVLRRVGVEHGDRVLLCSPSSIDLVIVYLAVLRLGATAVLASPTLTPVELGHLVADSDAIAAVGAAEVIASLNQALQGHRPVARLELEAASRVAVGAPEVREIVAAQGDVAVLAYTSGTTGVPKGVPLTHSNLLASIRGVLGAWGWSSSDVLIHALPLTHQHGLSGVHASLVSGSSTIVLTRFDPASLVSEVKRRSATVLFGVPTMYRRLLEWSGIGAADLRSLRLVVSGSAPLPVRLFEGLAQTFHQEPLERYGTTESGLDMSNPYRGPRRGGTVGVPLPGVEMAVIGAAGSMCATGTPGEIVVRGPQIFDGYWNRPEDTEAAFLPGGWFRTGDIGVVDPDDRHLRITGRSKELIISGGLNVYPREVELALEEHSSVQRAAVVGMPSARWGEEVWALVVTDGSPLDPSLDPYLRRRLAPHKRPKRVIVVDELPETSVGKVSRPRLNELAAEVASQAASVDE